MRLKQQSLQTAPHPPSAQTGSYQESCPYSNVKYTVIIIIIIMRRSGDVDFHLAITSVYDFLESGVNAIINAVIIV